MVVKNKETTPQHSIMRKSTSAHVRSCWVEFYMYSVSVRSGRNALGLAFIMSLGGDVADSTYHYRASQVDNQEV